MRDDVRQALAISCSSTIEERTIDITTTGRRSGEPRRIEICFNHRRSPGGPWPEAVLEKWVEGSPLAKVSFVAAD
jgi:hypothetical protein